MPPRRKSAPAGRVYKSSIPLQQTKLSAPKKRITYGKQSTRRAKEDSTLTQIGFVQLKDRPEKEDEEEDEEEESDYEEAAKKRKSKRRKTSGDKPSSTPWHTQTITQLDWSFSSRGDLEEDEEEVGREERSIYDVPSSSPTLHRGPNAPRLPALRRREQSPILGKGGEGSPILGDSREGSPSISGSAMNASSRDEETPILGNSREASPIQMPPPRTPRKFMRQEIPSSQSPATPFSVQSRGSARQLSPLLERSVNIAIPFNPSRTPQDNSKQRPKLEIKDTYESGNTTSQVGDSATSPEIRTSPAKSVRFALPEEEQHDDEEDEETPPSPSIKKEFIPYPSQIASQPQKVKDEILDSDDEDEDDLEEEIRPTDSRRDQEDTATSISRRPDIEDGDEIDHEITPTDSIPVQEDRSVRLPDDEDDEADEADEGFGVEVIVSTELIIEQVEPSGSTSDEPADEPETYYGDIGKETQFEADRIVSSFPDEEPSNTPEPGDKAEKSATGETQIGETQRISTQHVNFMEPRTANSDIFISIHPQHVTNIVNRTKNHEFRAWTIAPSVSRVWIYETKPVGALKYMAKISSAKRPGDINEDGLGNAEFNRKPRDKQHRAYEILQLYELANPVSLSEMISKGWMKCAPQKFSWVGPAVADELVANLKPPLFKDEDEDDPASSITDTQEVEEQLFNTISQFTQPSSPPHRHRYSQPSIEETSSMRPPSSTEHTTPREHKTPGPSQAETVDLTQPSAPRHPIQEEDEEEEVVWESPARPVPSSTPKLPTPKAANSDPRHGPDTIVPYSMGSSQFLSKSQLLPESLLDEDLPGPPRFVHDSDSEDDEL